MSFRVILILPLLLLGLSAQGQIIDVPETMPGDDKNISVQKISSSKDATVYIIWVRDTVKPHFHANHTETIYMVEGEARFYLGDDMHLVSAGDFFLIPRNTVHSVRVISTDPVKVISTQCPEFFGKDRVFVEPKKP
jgi:quercetin dioxygenase-like cupin family protein